jgi:hypothetical protein
MAERIEVEDEDGNPRTVTVASKGDPELDAMEIIIAEYYTRLQPSARARISRYVADRFYEESRYDRGQ